MNTSTTAISGKIAYANQTLKELNHTFKSLLEGITYMANTPDTETANQAETLLDEFSLIVSQANDALLQILRAKQAKNLKRLATHSN